MVKSVMKLAGANFRSHIRALVANLKPELTLEIDLYEWTGQLLPAMTYSNVL